MKRIMAALLVLFMCVSLLPAALAADDWKLVDADTGETSVTIAVPYGESVTMTANVRGDAEVSYRWYYADLDDPSGLITYNYIEGVDGNSYTIPSVTGYGLYQCQATDDDGTYKWVDFTVSVDNGLTAVDSVSGEKYASRTAAPGGSVELSIRASATDPEGITYQWYTYVPVPGEDYVVRQNIEGATASSYTVENVTEAKTYYCVVRDKFGAQSEVSFSLKVESDLKAWVEGEPDGTVGITRRYEKGDAPTLTVGADASENCKPLTYTWYEYEFKTEPNGFSYWSQIETPVGEGTSFTVPAIMKKTCYHCVVEDRFGNTESVSFELGIENHFKLEAEAGELSAPYGDNVTMKVSASADEGPLTYQWYTLEGWEQTPIEGETGTSLTVKVEKSANYLCIVSDPYEKQSINFWLTVDNGMTASAAGTDKDIATIHVPEGKTAVMTVDAHADNGELSYQWFVLETTEEGPWSETVPIEGATSASLESKAIADNALYHCDVKDIYGNERTVSFDIYVDDGFTLTPEGDYTVERGPLYPEQVGRPEWYTEFQTVYAKPGDTVTLAAKATSLSDSVEYYWTVFQPYQELDEHGGTLTVENVQGDVIYILKAVNKYGESDMLRYKIITSGEAPAGDPLDCNGDGTVSLPDAAAFLLKGGADNALKAVQVLLRAVQG